MQGMDRRGFLKLASALGASLAWGGVAARASSSGWRERRDLYPQGVASGWTVRAGAPSICSMGALGALNHSDREYIELPGLVERAKLLALSVDAV